MKTPYLTVIAGTSLLLLSACSKTKPSEPPPPVVPAQPVTTMPAPGAMAPAPVPTMPATTPTAHSSDAQFLLNQNPNAYTVQVLSAQNPRTVSSFMQRYSRYSFKQIQTVRNGQVMHVLFYGVYGSKAQAEQAARAFGETWIRPLRDVQMQITSGR